MKIKILETGEIFDVNDSYGCRLIEQGKAVIEIKPAPKAVKAAPKKEEPEKEIKARKGE